MRCGVLADMTVAIGQESGPCLSGGEVLSAESKNERLTPLSMRWRVGSLHVCVVIQIPIAE
jgi:hypothetical protein